MAQPLRKSWAWDAYLEWEARQPVRHELVDGEVHAIGGSTLAHDAIPNNLRRELSIRRRGGPCRLFGPDVKVLTGTGNARYPDAMIDCGAFVITALYAPRPVAVFEVLSRSTAWIDQGLKLRDYAATASIDAYVLISQDEPKALVYRRGPDGHISLSDATMLDGIEATIELLQSTLHLPLALLYEGIPLDGSAATA